MRSGYHSYFACLQTIILYSAYINGPASNLFKWKIGTLMLQASVHFSHIKTNYIVIESIASITAWA